MKKDRAARARDRRIRIMTDLNEPAICKIVMPHFLFLEPGRRVRRIGNGDETVVIRTLHVIDPRVSFGYLMEWEVGPGRKGGIVSVDFPNLKNACRRPAVALRFAQTTFILTRESAAPGQPLFAEE